MTYREINRDCIICGCNEREILWNKVSRFDKGIIDCASIIMDGGTMYNGITVICTNCGFVYINPMLDYDALSTFYRRSYREVYKVNHENRTVLRHTKSALRTIEKLSRSFKFQTILDIGCFTGDLVSALQELGYGALGLDIDKNLDCRYHDIMELKDIKFDLVTMFNTLEHIWDPILYLEQLKKHIGKCILIGVPNLYGRINCTVDAFFSNVHLWQFDGTSLRNLLKRAGYHIYGSVSVSEPMSEKIHLAACPIDDITIPEIKKPNIGNIKDRFTYLALYQTSTKMPIYSK